MRSSARFVRRQRAGRIVLRTPDLRVLSVAHDIGDRRIGRIVATALQSGLTVDVAACGTLSLAPAGAVCSTWPPGSRLRRFARSLVAPLRRRSRTLLVVDPDLIPAALLARAFGRTERVVVDVHEDYSAVALGRTWVPRAARRLLSTIARAIVDLARHADVVVVADEYLSPTRARQRLVVDNRPLFVETNSERRPFSCIYVGDVTPSRGVSEMIDVIGKAPGWTLDIVGPVGDPQALADHVANSGVAPRVRLLGRLEPAEATALMQTAEVGFVMLHDTPAYRHAAPSKLYEYFAAGLAVVGTPLPRIAALLEESGAGALAPDATAAADILRRWRTDGAELRERQTAARRWARENLPERDPFEQLMNTLGVASS